MSSEPLRSAHDLLARIRRLEDDGQVSEAIALAHQGASTWQGAYDWVAEISRLEQEGRLARPYREGIEALHEGDREDAVRLLSWVAGKSPRYREVSRFLYWATVGRDPNDAAPEAGLDDRPPPSLLTGGSGFGALTVVAVALFALLAGGVGGYLLAPRAPEATEVAQAQTTAPATPAPSPEPAAAPPPTPVAVPVEAPAPAATAPAPASAPSAQTAAAPTSSAAREATAERGARRTGGAGVSDVENPDLASEADKLALSCQEGRSAACFRVGDVYYYGRGVPRDLGAASRFYAQACDLGEARGCYNAGDMAEKGESVARDKGKAMSLFTRGCNLGDTQSCSRKSFLEVETTEVP